MQKEKKKSGNKKRPTFNSWMENPTTKPVHVIVDWSEIIYIQHHLGFAVNASISIPGARIRVFLRHHPRFFLPQTFFLFLKKNYKFNESTLNTQKSYPLWEVGKRRFRGLKMHLRAARRKRKTRWDFLRTAGNENGKEKRRGNKERTQI